jgi:hypothetical protein
LTAGDGLAQGDVGSGREARCCGQASGSRPYREPLAVRLQAYWQR